MNRQLILLKRPNGTPAASDIEYRESAIPEPGEGEVLVRNLYFSMDPAIRGWMDDAPNYRPAIPLGTPVHSVTLGRVVASRAEGYKEGDLVSGITAWEDYSISSPEAGLGVMPSDLGIPLSQFLGVLGPTGLTAYFGLLDVGQPDPGETVLVSAAAGSVGSIVGQIAKIQGCRAVGIAGSDEKCRWITEELGFDAAINYKTSASLVEDIQKACPAGVDVYFENVGGEILDAALMCLNVAARIPFCGAISGYNSQVPVPGPYNFWQLVVKRARIEGFLIPDYAERFGEGIAQLAQWMSEGRIHHAEHVVDGFENTLDTFLKLFDGSRHGKLVVRIAED